MTDTTTEVLRKRVIRERETEQRLRGMDTHELVALVHSLEDERDALGQERVAMAARAERWDTEAAAARIIIPRIEAERDAARAERDALQKRLNEMRHNATFFQMERDDLREQVASLEREVEGWIDAQRDAP